METNKADFKTHLDIKGSKKVDLIEEFDKSADHTPISSQIRDLARQMKENSIATYESSLEIVRRHPVTSITTAFSIGLMVGRFIRPHNKKAA